MHAGTYKTGTTALQLFLYRNAEALNAAGLYRPKTGAEDSATSWGHHDLARLGRQGQVRERWHALRAECREALPQSGRAVISSELFSNAHRASAFAPVSHIMRKWQVRVVIYLRRQDQYLESLYNHHIKSVGEVRSITEFAKVISKRLNYPRLLSHFTDAFGAENLTVRPYETGSLKGDICTDFLDVLGMEMPENAVINKVVTNPGLTREGVGKMLAANRQHQNNPKLLSLQRAMILKRYSAPVHYKHQFLNPGERAALIARYEEENADIARRFLNGQDQLFQA